MKRPEFTKVKNYAVDKRKDFKINLENFKINHFELVLEELINNYENSKNKHNWVELELPKFEKLPLIMEYSFDQLKL
jgi:hypothetical protein